MVQKTVWFNTLVLKLQSLAVPSQTSLLFVYTCKLVLQPNIISLSLLRRYYTDYEDGYDHDESTME